MNEQPGKPSELSIEDSVSSEAAVAQLWTDFHANRSLAAREAIFVHYMQYARSLAAQVYKGVARHAVEFNDLLQFAYVGLLESIDRFDPARSAQFRTYCTHRIRGSLLSGLEQTSEVRQQISFERRMHKERLASLKTVPSEGADEAISRMAMGIMIGFMLEGTGMCEPAPGAAAAQATGYDSPVWNEMQEHLLWLLQALPDDVRKVIQYHYFDFLPFERISAILGLSRGRISQLHRAGIDQLRSLLKDQDFVPMIA